MKAQIRLSLQISLRIAAKAGPCNALISKNCRAAFQSWKTGSHCQLARLRQAGPGAAPPQKRKKCCAASWSGSLRSIAT
jgi:hypothetical protein